MLAQHRHLLREEPLLPSLPCFVRCLADPDKPHLEVWQSLEGCLLLSCSGLPPGLTPVLSSQPRGSTLPLLEGPQTDGVTIGDKGECVITPSTDLKFDPGLKGKNKLNYLRNYWLLIGENGGFSSPQVRCCPLVGTVDLARYCQMQCAWFMS